MPDTEALLQDWKAKTDAATPGPWEDDGSNVAQATGAYANITPYQVSCMSYCYGGTPEPMTREDREFIAMSRTAVPRLMAAVEAIRALHRPTQVGTRSMCRNCVLPFPCATTCALHAALSGSEPDDRGGK